MPEIRVGVRAMLHVVAVGALAGVEGPTGVDKRLAEGADVVELLGDGVAVAAGDVVGVDDAGGRGGGGGLVGDGGVVHVVLSECEYGTCKRCQGEGDVEGRHYEFCSIVK